MTVCILKTFRHKLTAPGFGCTKSLRVFLKLRGVTRSDGALSPPTAAVEIIAAGGTARLSPSFRRHSNPDLRSRRFLLYWTNGYFSRRSQRPARPPPAARARQPRLVA